MLTTIAHCVLAHTSPESSSDLVAALQEAIDHVPNPSAECMIRNVAAKIAQRSCLEDSQIPLNCLRYRPDISTIRAVTLLAWSTATGKESALQVSIEKLHILISEEVNNDESSFECYQLCKEALEVLTVMFMLSPEALHSLMRDQAWQTFVIDLLLICPEK